MKKSIMIHLLSKNYIIDFEISFHFLKIFFTKYLKKIKIIMSKINDLSMFNEIKKNLVEIFSEKINALEIKQRFYEKF